MLPAQPNQSLIDGIGVLQSLCVRKEPVGSRELARRLDLEPTRCNRLLKTLAWLGLVRQLPDRRYLAGPGVHALAAQALYASGLLQATLPRLEPLRRFGGHLALGMLWRDQVTYLYHASPGSDTAAGLARVGSFPATRSSIGLCLLARLDGNGLRERLPRGPLPDFPGGLPELRSRLAEVSRAGFACVVTQSGEASIAVPILPTACAGLAVSGVLAEECRPQVREALAEAAAFIAADLGEEALAAGFGTRKQRPSDHSRSRP